MNLDNYFLKTLSVIEASDDASEDRYLLDALEKEGISSSMGAYLVLFIPIIFCRIISKTFEANFSNEYIEHKKDGTRKKYKFNENVLYTTIWEISESFIKQNSNNTVILKVASRSPEFPLINDALLKKHIIKTLVFSPVHIIL